MAISPRTPAKQVKEAARLLAAGKSQKDTATALGVHRTTVRKWCNDPDFLEAFERETLRLQREIHAGVLRRTADALDTLSELLGHPDDARIRLGAAKALLTAVGTTRPDGMGEGRHGGGGPQTVIVLGTDAGDRAVADAKARVIEARSKTMLPSGAEEE